MTCERRPDTVARELVHLSVLELRAVGRASRLAALVGAAASPLRCGLPSKQPGERRRRGFTNLDPQRWIGRTRLKSADPNDNADLLLRVSHYPAPP
jgi:hypothetical protein